MQGLTVLIFPIVLILFVLAMEKLEMRIAQPSSEDAPDETGDDANTPESGSAANGTKSALRSVEPRSDDAFDVRATRAS